MYLICFRIFSFFFVNFLSLNAEICSILSVFLFLPSISKCYQLILHTLFFIVIFTLFFWSLSLIFYILDHFIVLLSHIVNDVITNKRCIYAIFYWGYIHILALTKNISLFSDLTSILIFDFLYKFYVRITMIGTSNNFLIQFTLINKITNY